MNEKKNFPPLSAKQSVLKCAMLRDDIIEAVPQNQLEDAKHL